VLFDQVRNQVERLIPVFGVSREASAVLASFDILCSESLDLDVRCRAPEFSRINADGTPFQFALSLSQHWPAPLQFLGEAGRPGCGMQERLRAGYASLRELARECGVVAEVEGILPLLSHLAPQGDPFLLNDASGIFWFALGFWPDAPPSLTVYINGRWGGARAQWQRMDRFAAFFDSTDHWRSLVSMTSPGPAPLGMAVTLRPDAATSGRIYLHAFGVELSVYRGLFLAAATPPCAADAFDEFATYVMGDDVRYPTRSAVFSFELAAARVAGAKFELCAHCAFTHDAEAAGRISGWLEQLGAGHEVYRSTVSSLTRERPLSDEARPSLHAYVGVGARGLDRYASIYLNPGPALEHACRSLDRSMRA
jgi:hypothetical protein